MHMKYQSKRYGYSLEIPNEWIRRRRKPFSMVRGVTVSYESPERDTCITASVGILEEEEWSDKYARRWALRDFSEVLRRMPNSVKVEHFSESRPFYLDREENTLQYYYVGSSISGRLISSFHNGFGYVIQSRCRRNWDIIDKIIDSFKFGTSEDR